MARRAVTAAVLLATLAAGCSAGQPRPGAQPAGSAPLAGPSASQPTGAAAKPDLIRLPDGFAPEGIAIGPGPVAYLGSRETGAIYRADLNTGQGEMISPPSGAAAQGMKTDDAGRLYVAGRSGGDARVIDTNTGAVLVSYRLVDAPTEDNNLVNDVLLTADAWWLTDSRNAVLYRIARRPDGALPTQADVRKVPLTGDFANQRGINANGIAPTPDGRALLVVQSNTGRLFRVDPATGAATAVDLGAESLKDGDGLLLDGQRLYVMQNESNSLTVVELDAAASRGSVTKRITDTRFDAPTTVAAFDGRLYIPNARFDAPEGPSTRYDVVSVPRPE